MHILALTDEGFIDLDHVVSALRQPDGSVDVYYSIQKDTSLDSSINYTDEDATLILDRLRALARIADREVASHGIPVHHPDGTITRKVPGVGVFTSKAPVSEDHVI